MPGYLGKETIKDVLGNVCHCYVMVSLDKAAVVAITDDKYPDMAI